MILTHKIALDPNNKQTTALKKAVGVARFSWNWALAEWKKEYQAGGKPSGFALKRKFNALKSISFPWVYDSPKDANQRSFTYLQIAFVRFFKKISGYPVFKKKGEHDSFYLCNDQIRLKPQSIHLPKIGWVRLREHLRFEGKVNSATVSRHGGRWFVSLQVDLGEFSKPRVSDGTIGVDLGIKHAVVCSDGTVYDAPFPLKNNLARLRRANRKLHRRKKGSKRREKARVQLSKLYARVSYIRQDFLHKITTKLCSENQAVVIEDLSVQDMLRTKKNKKFRRAIADVGFYEFRRQMTYKSEIYKTKLTIAGRYFSSSKKCSACGAVRKKIELSEREFVCKHCGFVEDRDLNAAKNLKTLAVSSTVMARGDITSTARITLAASSVDEARTKLCLGSVLNG